MKFLAYGLMMARKRPGALPIFFPIRTMGLDAKTASSPGW